ncbi:MAG: hypothetical protein J7619_10970 [Dyadobacter sp.]|uniref:RHS repeat domain-containing protein n=1 Tax=Dyadobacter sp. TaxID=1914288 RepID=UPI001B11246F|nr:RHS repeat-associated core domain-containing protein [Dyadobacter sp.]MBO9613210.1 hypothetical protein [Dyadobacter sp.]
MSNFCQAFFKKRDSFFEYYLKDHLGNVRVLFDTTGKIKQRTDYYPFGLGIARDVPVQTQAVRNGVNRYLYNGKELQVGTGYLDFGARTYDPLIGRMTTVDRFAEQYVYVSGYQFALNNPVINIDMNGDSAWKVTNQWNDNFIAKFNKTLPGYIQKYIARNDRYTCDDLGLSLIMDFAKENALPFQWKTGAKNFDAASNEYSDFASFAHDVKAMSGAPDFQNNSNTVPVSAESADAGGILLNARPGNERAHHVQMIMRRSDDGGSLLIKQGNFVAWPRAQRLWGSGDPDSMRYLGTTVQTGSYNMLSGVWRNATLGSANHRFAKEERLIFRVFNFTNWNR